MLPGSLVEGSAGTKSSKQIGHVGWSRAEGRYEWARAMAAEGRISGEGEEDRLAELFETSLSALSIG